MSTDSTTARKRCVILVRISDSKQSGNESQLPTARRLAGKHGLDVAAEIFGEGQSGDDRERECIRELEAVLGSAHKQRQPITHLVIGDVTDRYARDEPLFASSMLERHRSLGLRWIITPTMEYDLWDPMHLLMLQIEFGFKNRGFLKAHAYRVLAGMLQTARAGHWCGSRVPFGYIVVRTPGEHGAASSGREKRRKSGKLAVCPVHGPTVTELFERYRSGESTRGLADWLTARTGRRWCHSSVPKVLRNEVYTGERVFGKRPQGGHARLVDGLVEAIKDGQEGGVGDAVRIKCAPALVSQELFLAVGKRLDQGVHLGRKKESPVWPLTGLMKCGACGAMLTSCESKGVGRFVCSRHREKPADCPAARYVRSDEALRRVRSTLAEKLLAGDAVAELVALAGQQEDDARKTWEAAQASAQKALTACDQKLATARRRLASADDDLVEDYQRVVRELKEERKAIEADLASLRGAEPVAEEGDSAILTAWLEQCRSLVDQGDAGEPATLNALLKELIAEARVWPAEKKAGCKQTVGKVEVVLPEWLSRVLSRLALRGGQHATAIVLVSLPATV